MTKVCTKCNLEKPLTNEYFSRRSDRKDGFETICKECKKEYSKRYYQENKKEFKRRNSEYREMNREQLNEYNREYRKRNLEALLDYNKKYYQKNKEEILEQKKDYYNENREEKLQYREKHYQANKGKLIKYSRKYYQKNKDRIAEYNKDYYEKNKEKAFEYAIKRKHRIRKLPCSLTLSEWNNIKEKFDNKCAYCGEERKLTKEHFIPLSKGGEYTVNNIIPVCRSCNCSKKDRSFFEWYPEQEFYSKQREKQILEYLNYIDEDIQQLALL